MGIGILIFGIVAGLLGIVGITMPIVYKMDKNNIELEKLKLEKELLVLQKDAEERAIKLLEEENKKYDRLIAE